MKAPIFTVSLDFELHWGRFDKYSLENCRAYYHKTREVIPKILELFEKHRIHATWATVGMLFAENVEEWESYQPKLKPNYKKEKISAYNWLSEQNNADYSCLFAPDLIQRILQTPYQEVGSHTFSHYYTCEAGQTSAQFRDDLKSAKKIAKDKFDLDLASLVFPRNQYNKQALDIVADEGFTVFRSNPNDWYWENTHSENLLKKMFRTGDALIPIGSKSSYLLPNQGAKLLPLPASRLFRPFIGNNTLIRVRINRIKSEMTVAAKNGEVYHLWWHPHNFGLYPKENLYFLEEIFIHFSELKEQFGMRSLNMKGSCELVLGKTVFNS
ncbi:MAG: polysaccharide deacetylase family protein [Bacteroidetes bacterium]|nr:polysaccharide deacetylase family protein [Bacteroidota bacterium]